MKPIRMVDLKTQYENIRPEVDRAMQQVIQDTAFINGPQVNQFAQALGEYLGTKHVIPCANGTDALQIALMALDLEPGDEVITPDFTFISTVEVVRLLGLKPVLVDVDEADFTLAVDKVREAITSRTRAIVPVHLYGQCARMDELLKLAREHDIAVIEDAAQSLGADYRSGSSSQKSGTLGDIGCTSFFPSKNLGCYGDGGALFTDDPRLADVIKTIANHGSHQKYYHSRIGVNSRLDTLQAAILQVKLQYLDHYNQARQKAAATYDQELSGIDPIATPAVMPHSTHIYHQYTLRLREDVSRDDLKAYLKDRGIPSMVYYPVPMHMQEAFSDSGYQKGDFPVSEKLSRSVISLPMHTELESDQIQYITETLKQYFLS
jgi:dTDP-4-amino-4,6-dideoxygalactose transaminase